MKKKMTLWQGGSAKKEEKAQPDKNAGEKVGGRTPAPDAQVPERPPEVEGQPVPSFAPQPTSPATVPEETPIGPMCRPTLSTRWHWSSVDWRFVFGHQAWGTILLILVPVALAQFAMLSVDPTREQYVATDPTISRKAKADSIPTWASVLIPLALFVLALFTGEFWLFRPLQGCLTNAVFTSIHFLVGWFTAMAVGSFTWWVTTLVVGRFRPDFLTRCEVENGVCTTEPEQGRQSFFCGPAMWSGMSAMYSTVYILWLVYFRIQQELTRRGAGRSFFLQRNLTKQRRSGQDIVERLVHEVGHTLALYAILIQFGFSWADAVSLLVDNRNHPSDVITGLVVGLLMGGLFSLNFIWLLEIAPRKDFPGNIAQPVSVTAQPLRSVQFSHARNRSASPATFAPSPSTEATWRRQSANV